MPVIPCPNPVNQCLPCNDDPLANLTAEGPDAPKYLAIHVTKPSSLIGGEFTSQDCNLNWVFSTESQEAADLAAAAVVCPPNSYTSEAKNGTYACPDGNVFTTLLPSGSVVADSQGHADALAQSKADHNAEDQKLCCSLPATMCFGSDFAADLLISGGTPPYNVALLSGALPTGVTLNPDGTVIGNLAATGVFAWVFRITDASGSGGYLDWAGSLRVIGIANVPNFYACHGSPFSDVFVLDGANGQVLWSVISGSLPVGLTLEATTGVFSGTPTEADTVYNFTIRALHHDGGFCDKEFTFDTSCPCCTAGAYTGTKHPVVTWNGVRYHLRFQDGTNTCRWTSTAAYTMPRWYLWYYAPHLPISLSYETYGEWHHGEWFTFCAFEGQHPLEDTLCGFYENTDGYASGDATVTFEED